MTLASTANYPYYGCYDYQRGLIVCEVVVGNVSLSDYA